MCRGLLQVNNISLMQLNAIELPKPSMNRIVICVVAAIGFLALAYTFFRLMNPKLEKQVALQSSPVPQKKINKLDFEEQNSHQSISSDVQNDADLTLMNLRKGYAVIPFLKPGVVHQLFEELKLFHKQPEVYKQQFSKKDQVEFGYKSSPSKDVYVVRNEQVPVELENFISYFSEVNTLALKILGEIETDLKWDSGQLTKTVSNTPLQLEEKSTSLLRLFAYNPSSEMGLAADAHEDLGLLTIIPCSQVAALEVMAYDENLSWVNVEKLADASHAVVMVGRTLEQMSNGTYQAAMHRIKQSSEKRYSIVYQLRAEPSTSITTSKGATTVGEWLENLKKNLTSVNGSY